MTCTLASLMNQHLFHLPLTVVDPCEGLGCHHSCIIHEGAPQCYCDYGHVLSEDGKSCFGESAITQIQ